MEGKGKGVADARNVVPTAATTGEGGRTEGGRAMRFSIGRSLFARRMTTREMVEKAGPSGAAVHIQSAGERSTVESFWDELDVCFGVLLGERGWQKRLLAAQKGSELSRTKMTAAKTKAGKWKGPRAAATMKRLGAEEQLMRKGFLTDVCLRVIWAWKVATYIGVRPTMHVRDGLVGRENKVYGCAGRSAVREVSATTPLCCRRALSSLLAASSERGRFRLVGKSTKPPATAAPARKKARAVKQEQRDEGSSTKCLSVLFCAFVEFVVYLCVGVAKMITHLS